MTDKIPVMSKISEEERYKAKLKMINNIREQIKEREQWIYILNEDIDEILIQMEKKSK